MKPSIFRSSPRTSPKVAPAPAPAPKPSPSFPKMGNPLRSISRRPAGRFKEGGMPMGPDGKPTFVGDGKGKMAKGGRAKAKMEAGGVTKKMPTAKQMGSLGMKSGGMKKMAGGGLAGGHKSADGIAKKGKTATKMVKMAKGGRYC